MATAGTEVSAAGLVKGKKNRAPTPERSLNDLPDVLLTDILHHVSTKEGGFAHGLVCRKWLVLGTQSLSSFRASMKTWSPSEDEVVEQMAAFPTITSVKVTKMRCLSEFFLCTLADKFKNLQSLEVQDRGSCPLSFSAEALGYLLKSCSRLASLQLESDPITAVDRPLIIIQRWLPQSVEPLPSLTSLTLKCAGKTFRPGLLLSARYLTKLVLSLDHQDYGDWSFADEIWELSSLRHLHLRQTRPEDPDDIWGTGEFLVPDSISQLTRLRTLKLEFPPGPEKLPEALGHLRSLKCLDISCLTLRRLPASLILLTKLQVLSLSCGFMKDLGVDPQCWVSLKKVSLHCDMGWDRFHMIKKLPKGVDLKAVIPANCLPQLQPSRSSSITSLRVHRPPSTGAPHTHLPFPKLKFFEVQGMAEVQVLPQCAPALEKMVIENWEPSYLLPETVGQFSSLKSLELRGCFGLSQLPDSIWQLTGLESLDVVQLPALGELPQAVGSLSSLKSLKLHDCASFQTFPATIGDLSSLQHLSLSLLPSLKGVPPSIGQLLGLTSLHLLSLTSLQSLQVEFQAGAAMQQLSIIGCSSLTCLPQSIGSLNKLNCLVISDCKALEHIPASIGELSRLHCLELKSRETIPGIPGSISCLTDLRQLHICSLDRVEALPEGLRNLKELRRLDIDCSSLGSFPLGLLQDLPRLNCSSRGLIRWLEDMHSAKSA